MPPITWLQLVGGGEQRVDRDLRARDVRRREERQALDVIPVHVREQHVVVARLAGGLARELVAERAHAGAGVDDQAVSRDAERTSTHDVWPP